MAFGLIGSLQSRLKQVPIIAVIYRQFRDRWLRFRRPESTPLGFKLVGTAGMDLGLFEQDETELVRRLLPMTDLFVNVGANVGYYCCLGLREGKEVLAFEPLRSNLDILIKNIRANGWENHIELFPLALSDRPGIIPIYGAGTGASLVKGWSGMPEWQVNWVPCTSFDRVIGKRLYGRKTLILVDIEGAERSFLAGASEALEANPKPVWIVEIDLAEHQPGGSPTNPHFAETFEVFWQRGYAAFAIGIPPIPVGRELVERMQREGRNVLGAHNFLFVDQGRADEINTLLG